MRRKLSAALGSSWTTTPDAPGAPSTGAFLAPRLAATPTPDAARTRRLIADQAFERRAAAKRELARHPDLVEDLLREALAASRSAEQRAQLARLLEAAPALTDPERVRRWRAVVALRRIATPEARVLLERVARSPATSPEATAARDGLATQ